MKKIVYVVSTLRKSGPTNQLFNVVSNLDKSVFTPIFITLSPEPKDSRWKDYEKIGIEIHSLNLSRFGGLLFAKSRLSALINEVKPNFIHTQGIRSDILVSKIHKKIPHVATVRNFPQEDYFMKYGRLKSFFMIKTHSLSMRNIDRIVGCSVSVANNLVSHFGLSNVVAIPNGVDNQSFFVDKSKASWLRQKLNLQNEAVIWITTGHLSARKDPIFLINSWFRLTKALPNYHLVFLGLGELEKACHEIAKNKKNIHLLGQVANVVDYLQGANYFVSASKSEGLPNAALEAMACGLPILLSDIEPHKEIYSIDPKIGELFKLGDEFDFLISLKRLAGSDYEEHSSAALSLVQSELSAKEMSKKYQNVYLKLGGSQ